MTYDRVVSKRNTTGALNVTGTAYPSRFLLDHSLSFRPFSFGHCNVCPSSINVFWLPPWYLPTFLLFNNILVLPSGVGNTTKIAIFRMCYRENGTVKFLETLADNVFRHNYSMIHIYKNELWENFGVTQVYPLKRIYIYAWKKYPIEK